MKVRFLPEAATELDEAVAFYNEQKPGLGTEFAQEIRDGLARMQDRPKAWQRLGPRVVRYLVNRFPYGIVYARLPTEIVVVAVMHLSRKPKYWKSRLKML